MSKLSDLLKSQPISAQQAADIAEETGVHLRYGTIAAYWAGSRHGRPSLNTLTALAKVTGIPLPKLQEAAWGTPAPLGMYSPPAEAALLDARQRRVLDDLIRMLVNGATREYEQSESDDLASSQPGAQSPKDQEVKLAEKSEHPATDDALSALADDLSPDVLGEDRESG